LLWGGASIGAGMSKNPSEITVKTPTKTTPVENVETWWYEELELVIRHKNDDESRFRQGVVVN
jgi:uncharacterized protein YneR